MKYSNCIYFRSGRFTARLQTPIRSVVDLVKAYYPVEGKPSATVDFDILLLPSKGVRRFVKPQVRYICNGVEAFNALPVEQAYPMLEWGLNWSVTQRFNEALVIHAAVLEKNNRAVILPGLPGAGKSTLCAALTHGGGWRLLSDELTLYEHQSNRVLPNPRPISLKNQSIPLIQNGFNVEMTPVVHDTLKGSVSHTKPPKDSLQGVETSVEPSHIIFPRFNRSMPREAICEMVQAKSEYFVKLADNSFNYSILGVDGFKAVGRLVSQCHVYDLEYGGDFKTVLDYFEGIAVDE